MYGAPSRLRVLDLKTGKIIVGPEATVNTGNITWSPDDQRMAFEKEVARSFDGMVIPPLHAVFVLNAEAGTVSKLADGTAPTWSPSGEWIAFYDYSPGRDDIKHGWYAANANRVSMVHPDGTGYRVLFTFHRDWYFNIAPVWSPDSKSLLINRIRDEEGNMDIYSLDLDTLKLTTKLKKTLPVYGWVRAK
jgi:Tol biopolymer transport system component